jgi:hypothetical protein
MSLPFESLTSATSPGSGTSRDLEDVQAEHTLIIFATGSPAGFVVHLEGSHDDTNWVDLGSANEGTPFIAVSYALVRYVRARLFSITGGSSPTVSASIASR